MPSTPLSVRPDPDPDPVPGESKWFGDVELIAAPIRGCGSCAFNLQRVGKYTCGNVSCNHIIWVTPLQYITHRLTS